MSACGICHEYGHPKAVHVATCVICGRESAPLSLEVLRSEFEDSPYGKGYFIYKCDDEERHAEIRRLAGDPERTPGSPPKFIKGEKETLQKLL